MDGYIEFIDIPLGKTASEQFDEENARLTLAAQKKGIKCRQWAEKQRHKSDPTRMVMRVKEIIWEDVSPVYKLQVKTAATLSAEKYFLRLDPKGNDLDAIKSATPIAKEFPAYVLDPAPEAQPWKTWAIVAGTGAAIAFGAWQALQYFIQ